MHLFQTTHECKRLAKIGYDTELVSDLREVEMKIIDFYEICTNAQLRSTFLADHFFYIFLPFVTTYQNIAAKKFIAAFWNSNAYVPNI